MKICLDAGHYGRYNQSSVVKSYYESEAMWKLTNYQKQFLEEYSNVTVILTRTDINKDRAVYDRGHAAKGCDLFISNHSNAASTESTDYPVVIRSYDNKNNSDKLASQLANKITSLMATRQPGRTWTRRNSNGGEYYGVLRGARAAGLSHYYIIEHSFHTNKNAATWLLNESNIKAMAKAEVEVIAAYYGLKKKTVSTSTQLNATGSYLVKVTADVLNVRAGAGTNYKINTQAKKGEVYTIVETKNNFGKLKSGAGWICLDYTAKV